MPWDIPSHLVGPSLTLALVPSGGMQVTRSVSVGIGSSLERRLRLTFLHLVSPATWYVETVRDTRRPTGGWSSPAGTQPMTSASTRLPPSREERERYQDVHQDGLRDLAERLKADDAWHLASWASGGREYRFVQFWDKSAILEARPIGNTTPAMVQRTYVPRSKARHGLDSALALSLLSRKDSR